MVSPLQKKPVTLRLEERQIALAKQLGYQALMQSWINEGITREERLRRGAEAQIGKCIHNKTSRC